MPLSKPTRRILTALLVVIVIAAVGWLALPLVLEQVIRSKLGAAAEAHLGARLLIGKIDYRFPYAVTAHSIRLKKLEDDAEIFSAPSIQFALADWPTKSGPLQIEKIVLEQPMVRVIERTPAAASATTAPATPAPASAIVKAPPQAQLKLSDLFRLRLLSIRDGQVRYEARAAGGERAAANPPAVVWDNLNTDLRLTPTTGAQYAWDFTADSGPSADVAASGSIDIDRLVVEVKQLAVNARADAAGIAALPPAVQELLKRFDAQGVARLEASGLAPLRDPASSQFAATIQLSQAQAQVKEQSLRGDVTIKASKQPHAAAIEVSVPTLKAQVGTGSIEIARAAGHVDPRGGKWKLSELAVSFEEISWPVPSLNQSVEHLKGRLHFEGEQLLVQNVTWQIDRDQFGLVQAVGQVVETGGGGVEWRDINLIARLARPHAAYEGPVGHVLRPLDASGEFMLRGSWSMYLSQQATYDLTAATRGAELRLGEQKLAITNVRGETSITPQRVTIRRFVGSVFDGALAATGNFDTSVKPMAYSGDLSIQQMDVALLANHFVPSESPRRLAGRCDATISVEGKSDGAESLVAKGEMRVTDGHFWEIPFLDRVVSRVKLAKEALSSSEAAAIFDVSDAKVYVRRAALNSPALGLQASGVIEFDGDLDLEVTAAPLGDWERHIKKTGLPIVSDLAGNFAGGIQRLVNAATSQLLFQFKVTGPGADPRVEAVPSPIITEQVAQLLAKMIKREVNLLDALKEK